MKFRRIAIALISSILLLTSTTDLAAQQRQSGNATYYGNKSHGRRTSSGQVYHKDSLTCAHRTLPFGTKLLVKNKRNGREVVVTVTDRGPYRKGAIVDLSMAAAQEIDMVRAGVVPVEVCEYTGPLIKVPNYNESRNPNTPAIKGMNFYDPATAKYYSAAEWEKLNNQRQAETRAKQETERRHMAHAKAKIPAWTIDNNRHMAKATK